MNLKYEFNVYPNNNESNTEENRLCIKIESYADKCHSQQLNVNQTCMKFQF